MIDALATAASALRLSDRRLTAAAHDAANLNTADTAVLRAVGRQAPTGHGVATQMQARVEHRAELAAEGPDGQRAAAPAIDVAVEQIGSVHQARAQARVTQTADDMLGALVDIVG